jgi:hypothetical protein
VSQLNHDIFKNIDVELPWNVKVNGTVRYREVPNVSPFWGLYFWHLPPPPGG